MSLRRRVSERQKTVGVGSPSPTHSMLTRSPTMAVILSPGVMVTVGGPVSEDEKQYYGITVISLVRVNTVKLQNFLFPITWKWLYPLTCPLPHLFQNHRLPARQRHAHPHSAAVRCASTGKINLSSAPGHPLPHPVCYRQRE